MMPRKNKFTDGKKQIILLVLLPVLVYYIIFFLYPVTNTFLLTFYKWSILTPKKFIGLSNYSEAIFEDKILRIVFRNTFYFAIVVVSALMVGGLILALLLNGIRRFTGVFRLIYFLPVMTAIVASAVVWKWLYQPNYGLFNVILMSIGLSPQVWLQSTKLALPSIMIMSTWREIGFVAIIYLTGLKTIPRQLYEAAEIDGATSLRAFFHITLPLLKPIIVFILLTESIRTFQVFTQIYIMTGGKEFASPGGPLHSTEVVVLYMYKMGILFLRLGYASCITVLIVALLVAIAIVQFKFSRTKWEF